MSNRSKTPGMCSSKIPGNSVIFYSSTLSLGPLPQSSLFTIKNSIQSTLSYYNPHKIQVFIVGMKEYPCTVEFKSMQHWPMAPFPGFSCRSMSLQTLPLPSDYFLLPSQSSFTFSIFGLRLYSFLGMPLLCLCLPSVIKFCSTNSVRCSDRKWNHLRMDWHCNSETLIGHQIRL